MTYTFLDKSPSDATMAAFYRFLRTILIHGDMTETEAGGEVALKIQESIRARHDAMELINWPNKEEDDLNDKTSSISILGAERIAEVITHEHEFFVVDSLFVEDQGDEHLAKDAKRGRHLLENLLIPEAEITYLPFDEEAPDIDEIDIRIFVLLSLSEDILDRFIDDEASFDELIDYAIEKHSSK